MTETQAKLQRGVDNLQEAGNNPDLLGVALLVFHGALEDHFRDVLESTSALPATQRARVRDKGQVQWMQLVDLMQQYHRLSNTHRHWILSTNRFRQEFAHGSKFNGNRREVERYGSFVRTQINGSGSSRPIVNRRQPETATHSTQANRSQTENANRYQLDFSNHSIQAARLRAEKQFDRGNLTKRIRFGCLAFGPFLFLAVMFYVSRPNVSVRDRLPASQTLKQDRATLAKYNSAIKFNPRNAVAYKKRADLKFKKLDDDLGALADYDRAIKLDPKYRQDAINNMRQAAKRSDRKTHKIISDKLADWQVR